MALTCPAVLVIEYPGLLRANRVELRCTKGTGHKGRCSAPPPSALPLDYPKTAEPLITWNKARAVVQAAKAPSAVGTPTCKCGRNYVHEASSLCL